MFLLLLAIIYVAFISLGLPDSLLGSAWPVMHQELSVPISYAGIVSMIISAGTIVSSLMSDRVTRRFGTGLVTAVSVLLTAGALFGFSVSGSFALLCIFAVPYGLEAGAIDAALNNYVALHYSSRHMSWLHCFWGVGASVSPYIMGYALSAGLGWKGGYRIVSVIQMVLTAILFLALPLWRNKDGSAQGADAGGKPLTFRQAFGIRGVVQVTAAFCAYCAFESTCGLWASSYLVGEKAMGSESAATFASLFFLGITLGRFISGFFADRVGDKGMIRIGLGTALCGVVLIVLPVPGNLSALVGLAVAGLGAAPVYPAIIHATPDHFGKENSHAVIGMQMASAYLGSTLMPPVFGLIAGHISIALYPFYLAFFLLVTLLASERLNKIVAGEKPA